MKASPRAHQPCSDWTTNRTSFTPLLFCTLHLFPFNPALLLSVCLAFQGEEEEGKKSILNVDPEVQAMMELTGKTLHSEGFRELEEDLVD